MNKIYRLYIDESGDHSYGKSVLKKIAIKSGGVVAGSLDFNDYPELRDVTKRYLGLTGCIVAQDDYVGSFLPKIDELKNKHFGSNQIILHRKEIINKKGPFWRLRDQDKEKDFNKDILLFLEHQNFRLITVVIDKLNHIIRYEGYAYHPYHFCLSAMLERYCGFLRSRKAKGDVMAESRGGVEDNKLKSAYQNLYLNGTQYWKGTSFQEVLTSREIKIKPKAANIAAIQIADLAAFPSKQSILFENKRTPAPDKAIFGGMICNVLEKKYNNYNGRISGYGKVFIK